MTKPDIAWDLSVIFPSATDPSIDKAIDFIQKAAEKIVTNYQGKIINFSSKKKPMIPPRTKDSTNIVLLLFKACLIIPKKAAASKVPVAYDTK